VFLSRRRLALRTGQRAEHRDARRLAGGHWPTLRLCPGCLRVGRILFRMSAENEDVLKFISRQGRTLGAISERFPGFDMLRLVRAGLVEERDIEPETQAHGRTSPPADSRLLAY
jgi:hypothetical protein